MPAVTQGMALWVAGEKSHALDGLIEGLVRQGRVSVAGRAIGFAPDAIDAMAAHALGVALINVTPACEEDAARLVARVQSVLRMPAVVLVNDSALEQRTAQWGAYGVLLWPETLAEPEMAAFRTQVGFYVSLAYTAEQHRRKAAEQPAVGARVARGFPGIIAIGASAGGTEAIEALLCGLPPGMPGIVITQHMPAGFTTMYAERLDRTTRHAVRECGESDVIRPGEALLAPGGNRHMRVVKREDGYYAQMQPGGMVSANCPSVDVLFSSVAHACGKNAVGIILTGMGADGAQGLLAMRRAGAYTIAQDEATSAVYGMPKAAQDAGGVVQQCALNAMSAVLLKHLAQFG